MFSEAAFLILRIYRYLRGFVYKTQIPAPDKKSETTHCIIKITPKTRVLEKHDHQTTAT